MMKLASTTTIVVSITVIGLATVGIYEVLGRARALRLVGFARERLAAPLHEITIFILSKLQPLLAFLFFVPLFFRLKIYLNDRLLGDRWFAIRRSDSSDIVTFWVLPVLTVSLGGWLYRRFLHRRLSKGKLLVLLFLPLAVVAVWYSSFHRINTFGISDPFEENDKIGCRTKDGRVLLEPRYDFAVCALLQYGATSAGLQSWEIP